MLDYTIIVITAILGTVVWTSVINPYMASRPKKASFIRPIDVASKKQA